MKYLFCDISISNLYFTIYLFFFFSGAYKFHKIISSVSFRNGHSNLSEVYEFTSWGQKQNKNHNYFYRSIIVFLDQI